LTVTSATEACLRCGVLDALGRHAGDCSYALEIGLPRLADGEDPIDPSEPLNGADQVAADMAATEQTAVREEEPVRPSRSPRVSGAPANPNAGLYTGLWMSYTATPSGLDDAIVFGSEIEALRFAVASGQRVVKLELGKSLQEQVRD
jgi:hypothetical protein